MDLSESHLSYWVLCFSLICLFVSLLSPSSSSFFNLRPVRGLLTVMLVALCWSWTEDYQTMYHLPVFTLKQDTCEGRVELLEFKQDYAKLQRDVYIKAMGVMCLGVCMAVAVKEKQMQTERGYYQTSIKVERQDKDKSD